jgi:NAD(P)-dependent dehydrogenase (short-subunit alcohol dehydrogenase family)
MSVPIAVITGAASGIGRAVVDGALRRGWRVAALDLDEFALGTLGAGDADERLLRIPCDVSSEAQVEAAFDRVVAEWGTPTGVVCSAGIERNHPPEVFPLGDWDAVIAVNLTGTFLTCRAAIRRLRQAQVGGSLVCVSSPAAFVGFAGGGNGAYAASKGGVSALVRSLALDAAAGGIRVNAVVPGATDTPLLGSDAETLADAARDQIPLGRMARPDEIADAALWLLSAEASYVTGSHLVCDGGLLAKSANDF